MRITTAIVATTDSGTEVKLDRITIDLIRELDGKKVTQIKLLRHVHQLGTGASLGLKDAKDICDYLGHCAYHIT